MNKPPFWIAALAVAVAAIGLLFYFQAHKLAPEPRSDLPAAAAPAPQASAEPQIRYPIEAGEQPLPPLDESDAAIRDALAGLFGDRSFYAWLNLDGFVRRIVATIDNLPREKVALRLMPVKPAPGRFVTAGEAETTVIGPANYVRYSPYVRIVEAVDAKKLVAFYTRFYPLFQQAYRDLGYPQGYFNDRLVEVIDVLLATPEVNGPVRLVRPKVYFRFADPDLEALPAGQKILVRIGPENAAKVKASLREIRSELVAHAPQP